jgi:TolA-binding protein
MRWYGGFLLVLATAAVCWPGFRSRSDNEWVTVRIQEAQLLMSDEKYDDALAVLKKVVKDYPSHPKTEIALATINHCYQILGGMNEAFTYFCQVESLYAGQPIADVAAYMAVPVLITRERYADALAKCQAIIARQADDSYWAIGAMFNMANIYCEKLQDKEKGIEIYQAIVRRNPGTQFADIAKMELQMNEQ